MDRAPEPHRRALITAGASGIGAVLAERAVTAGYEVIVSDRDEATGEQLAQRIGCRFIPCDLAQGDDVLSLGESVGAVTLLVNNGGISGPTVPLIELDSTDWRKVLEVNLTAQFLTSKAIVPKMIAAARGGTIINMSSVAARIGYPNRSAYAASKTGVLGLTAALARELGPHNIRVNAVLPATTRGARIDAVIRDFAAHNQLSLPQAEAAYLTRHATGRMIEPEEIADTILFLASDSARSITGQFIGVDGGFQ